MAILNVNLLQLLLLILMVVMMVERIHLLHLMDTVRAIHEMVIAVVVAVVGAVHVKSQMLLEFNLHGSGSSSSLIMNRSLVVVVVLVGELLHGKSEIVFEIVVGAVWDRLGKPILCYRNRNCILRHGVGIKAASLLVHFLDQTLIFCLLPFWVPVCINQSKKSQKENGKYKDVEEQLLKALEFG